jgi:hypothetical protein
MNEPASLMNDSYSFYILITTPANLKASGCVDYRGCDEVGKMGTMGMGERSKP